MSAWETRSTAPYTVITKPVSALCNLACHYCYYSRVMEMYPDPSDRVMSDAVLETFTRQTIKDSGGRAIFAWQGGEPLLAGLEFFRKALEVQRRYTPPGYVCMNTIQTNGTLLDEEWCRFLKENQVLVGISIDGPASLHDVNRVDHSGRPSHERVVRGLRLLRRYGVEYNALVVVSQANVRHGGRVFRYLVDQGVTWTQFIPCTEREDSGAVTEHSVSGPEYGAFMCEVFDAWYPDHVGTVSVRMFENIAQRATGGPPELCVFSPTCGNAVVLEANGDVYACDHFVYPDYRLGNIMETPIGELVRREPCRRLARAKLNPPEKCATCPYQGLCYGGCPKGRFDPVSRSFGDPALCEGYRAVFEHAYETIQAIGWRAVRGEPLIPPGVGSSGGSRSPRRRRRR